MPADHYAASGERWALDAELVYRPIAAALVATSPHRLSGHIVLDAGAGTGAASAALRRCGARVLAFDLSPAMLSWQAAARPPCAAADVRALPLPACAVDDCVAAFVLNHLRDPGRGLAELARVTRPGGAIMAAVFANDSRSEARDRIDAAARAAGWQPPSWYRAMKATAAPLLGTADAMAAAAREARLAQVHTEERQVDVGVTEPEQLVRYRLGHVAFAAWLDAIGPERAATVAYDAEEAVGDTMAPYRPTVVFLRATARRRPRVRLLSQHQTGWPGARARNGRHSVRPDRRAARLAGPMRCAGSRLAHPNPGRAAPFVRSRRYGGQEFELMFDSEYAFPCWSYLCSNNRHGTGHAQNRVSADRYSAGRNPMASKIRTGHRRAGRWRHPPA